MRSWMVSLFCIINFLLYLIVVGLWISIPEELTLNISTSVAALVMTLVLIVLNKKKFIHFYQSQLFQKLVGACISAFFVFVIFGFSNYLAYKNPVVWDVTKGKRNSLTEQTLKLLKEIDGPVSFRIFALKKDYDLVRTLIELYRLQKKDIEITFVDAELQPQVISEVGVTKVPSIEVSQGDKRKIVEELSELALSNALVKVTRKKDPVLYFVTGHGEIDLSSSENEGGVQLTKLLKANTYQLKPLNLRQSSNIPNDAAALIIWGPKEAFFKAEIKSLEEFLKKGGNLVLALDPDLNSEGQTELISLMERYGLKVRNNLVIDRIKHANGSNGTVPVIHKFDEGHPISKGFKGTVFLPLASSLEVIKNSPVGDKWKILAQSNHYPAAWGETSKEEILSMKMTYNEEKDVAGPLGYVAAFEDEKNKILTFTNSTFVINTYRKFPQNFMLFINAVNWLVGEERLISFNTPALEDRPLFMSKNQIGLIFYFTIIFCPLLFTIAAFVLYKRRQKL